MRNPLFSFFNVSFITGMNRCNINNSTPLSMSSITSNLNPESTSIPKISWEPEVAKMIHNRLVSSSKNDDINQTGVKESQASNKPFLVAIVGIPGSGKTTSSSILSNQLFQKFGISNTIIPMDGYHYPMATLQSMPNPKDVIYRRGAPDTFDVTSLYNDLKDIRTNFNRHEIYIPGFDHAKGDPEPNLHTFRRLEHDVVICEGLYLLHGDDGWGDISTLFDYTIFIDADIDYCMDRLKVRNKCIPGYTPEEIDIRVDAVDRNNALKVLKSKVKANKIVTGDIFR